MTMIQPHQTQCCHQSAVFTSAPETSNEALDPRVFEQVQCMSRDEISQFQYQHGLPETGEADVPTLRALEAELQCAESEAAEQVSKDELYRNNPTTMRGQRALNAFFADRKPLEVDGIRGPNTTARIEEFQCKMGLEQTGKLDVATQKALFTDGKEVEDRCDEPGLRGAALKGCVEVKVSRGSTQEDLRKHGNLNATGPVPVESKWTDYIDTSHNGVLQHATNIAAGFGDGVSDDSSDKVRNATGGNASVEKDSLGYIASHAFGSMYRAIGVGLIANKLSGSTATSAAAK